MVICAYGCGSSFSEPVGLPLASSHCATLFGDDSEKYASAPDADTDVAGLPAQLPPTVGSSASDTASPLIVRARGSNGCAASTPSRP